MMGMGGGGMGGMMGGMGGGMPPWLAGGRGGGPPPWMSAGRPQQPMGFGGMMGNMGANRPMGFGMQPSMGMGMPQGGQRPNFGMPMRNFQQPQQNQTQGGSPMMGNFMASRRNEVIK